MNRREHLKNCKKSRERIFAWAVDKGILRRKRLRNWMRHPIANTTYWWWGHVWHKPKMIWSVASFGEINHEWNEADYAIISMECKRCAWEDPNTVITAFPRHTEEIIELFNMMGEAGE